MTPYGEVYSTTGNQQTMFGFTGEPTNGSGLVNLRARDYHPALGIFPSLDPLDGNPSQPMSLNRYTYVQANVINATDPSGMYAQPTQWGNPFDANCFYLADGLAKRFSGNDPTAYNQWFQTLIQKSWDELQGAAILGTAATVTQGLHQGPGNATIIPKLFSLDPKTTLSALRQFSAGNRNLLGYSAAVIADLLPADSAAIPGAGSLPKAGEFALVAGLEIAASLVFVLAWAAVETDRDTERPQGDRCGVEAGPSYFPNGIVIAPTVGKDQAVIFYIEAEFSDQSIGSASGFKASCCEIRQYIRWAKGEGERPMLDFSHQKINPTLGTKTAAQPASDMVIGKIGS